MKLVAVVILSLVGLVVLIIIGLVAFQKFSFKDESIYAGEAYGFSIGDSYRAVFEKAVRLKATGKIEEIHRWPEGASHFEFSEANLPEAIHDVRWTMIVNVDWWNNSIRLEFKDGSLVGIHRFRMWGEMP